MSWHISIREGLLDQLYERRETKPVGEKDDPYIGKQVGNYRLVQKLGQGQFGKVYRAQHVYIEIQVAIKILSNLSAWQKQLFLKEAKIMANVSNRSN